MRDYRVDKTEHTDYILSTKKTVDPTGKELLTVKFADGRVFTNIEYSKENIAKITEQLEKQVAESKENLPIFKRRRSLAGITTAGAVVGAPFIGHMVAEVATTFTRTNPSPLTVAIGIGTISIGIIAPFAYKLMKNDLVVSEMETLNYRDEHAEELKQISEYPNALNGLPKKVQQRIMDRIEAGENPFSVADIDKIYMSDMETIVGNVEKEKTYSFKYPGKNQ